MHLDNLTTNFELSLKTKLRRSIKKWDGLKKKQKHSERSLPDRVAFYYLASHPSQNAVIPREKFTEPSVNTGKLKGGQDRTASNIKARPGSSGQGLSYFISPCRSSVRA